MAPIGNTSWVCDPRWESYALEQAERLKSHARAKKVVHTFAWNPLYETICLVLRIKIVLSLLLLKTSISATLRVLIDNMIFFSLNDSQKFPPLPKYQHDSCLNIFQLLELASKTKPMTTHI